MSTQSIEWQTTNPEAAYSAKQGTDVPGHRRDELGGIMGDNKQREPLAQAELSALLDADPTNPDTWPSIVYVQILGYTPAPAWEGLAGTDPKELRAAVLVEAATRANRQEHAILDALIADLFTRLPKGGPEWRELDEISGRAHGLLLKHARAAQDMVPRIDGRLCSSLEALTGELLPEDAD
ncbi:MAG: hypothetical protein ACYCYF_04430 [Anaerolineae bacterium]